MREKKKTETLSKYIFLAARDQEEKRAFHNIISSTLVSDAFFGNTNLVNGKVLATS